jgi:spore coat protein U-like protein
MRASNDKARRDMLDVAIAKALRMLPLSACSVALLVLATAARAQSCTFTIGDMPFGAINPSANTSFAGTSQITASCSGKKNSAVVVCASIGDGQYGSNNQGSPRLMSNGTSSLQFSFYTSAANTTVWGSYVWPWAGAYTGNSFTVTLGATGSGSFATTLYGLIYAGQQTVTTGAYSSVFNGSHTYFSYGYSGTGTCAAQTINAGYQRPTFTVSATYSPTCALSAANLNFPSAGQLSGPVDATSALFVICSYGTPYVASLGLGNGVGVTSPTARRMTGAGGAITYGLYRDLARSQPWGDSAGTNTASGTGAGGTQTLTVYGRVPAQTTPPPGLYSDTIVTTITY